jgi:hypothetical protein
LIVHATDLHDTKLDYKAKLHILLVEGDAASSFSARAQLRSASRRLLDIQSRPCNVRYR